VTGWFVSDEKVPVEVGCLCPGTPHDKDTISLRAELGPEGGYAVLRAIRAAAAQGDTEYLAEFLGRAYAEHGIVEWTFLDEDGEPVPCTTENIRALKWGVLYPVAERGDVLYAEELMAPLRVQASASSPNGRTARSTSATKRTTSTHRKPSK
jgi:hypothetical protein